MQLIRWNRLNARLGLCLGPINALAYLVLISFVIFRSQLLDRTGRHVRR